jgi:hypothetical protein
MLEASNQRPDKASSQYYGVHNHTLNVFHFTVHMLAPGHLYGTCTTPIMRMLECPNPGPEKASYPSVSYTTYVSHPSPTCVYQVTCTVDVSLHRPCYACAIVRLSRQTQSRERPQASACIQAVCIGVITHQSYAFHNHQVLLARNTHQHTPPYLSCMYTQ